MSLRKKATAPEPSWSLRQFALWWLRTKPFNIQGYNRSVHAVGPFMGVTLYQLGPFQVQMFMAPPHATAPLHSHLNADSIEVWIGSDEKAVYWSAKGNEWFGMKPVDAGETHTATIGDSGVAWFSIQKWLNGVPLTSIELDWSGDAIDAGHREQLQQGT